VRRCRGRRTSSISRTKVSTLCLNMSKASTSSAQHELYDHLVAYVGEVLRLRIHGRWDVRGDDRRRYPYLVGAHHDPVMPINVVWRELSGYAPVNLRTEAANEVRRTRKPPEPLADGTTGLRAAAPKGVLATLPADSYEVTKR